MKTKIGGKYEEIVIPELDELAKTNVRRKLWTQREEQILIKYAPLVRVRDLIKHLPGRSISAIESKIDKLRNGGLIP